MIYFMLNNVTFFYLGILIAIVVKLIYDIVRISVDNYRHITNIVPVPVV